VQKPAGSGISGLTLITDSLVFDSLSPCFDSAKENTFTVYPVRRQLIGITWAGSSPFSYNPVYAGAPGKLWDCPLVITTQ
jgi:hypothetical protein